MSDALDSYGDIHSRIVDLLEVARRRAARNINALMTATYWEIGRRIVEFEQGGAERSAYGEALMRRLAVDLTRRFGRGFSARNIDHMRRFFLSWPILQTPSAKSRGAVVPGGTRGSVRPDSALAASPPVGADLSALATRFPLPWSAYVRLLAVKGEAARRFYEEEAIRGGWSVRQLDRQVNSQFYERTALSKEKGAMLERGGRALPSDAVSFDVAFKDPFVLEFLDLKDQYSESDLEDTLVDHLADFLLELGDDFAFVGRQRRLRLDDSWFRVDLLFFHRRLRCLVVVDLKVGRFSYADAGQTHMYLNYSRENWMKPGENPPVGLILCAAKGAAEAHYALDNLPTKVLAAEYRIMLPDEAVLARELERSRQDLEARRVGAAIGAKND